MDSELLHASPVEPGSQVLTFLIADVRGYTRFTEEHGDEAAARLTERFSEIAHQMVAARDGKVIELRGDEALAVFASARQALRTAVELQERFADVAASDPALPLKVGIGLDAGDAVPVAGGYRGGALNLAARLCSLAGPGEVFASETVIGLARKTEGFVYIDRGDVSLKGLSDPVHVTQIAPEGTAPRELPPLQHIIVTHPTNLPDEPTPFIGREGEIAQISGLVGRPKVRLVTLTGPGGTGKTRLALQVGAQLLHQFEDGVFFVSLASINHPDLVPAAIAAPIGVREHEGELLADALTDHLKNRHVLLVLDTFEHLLEASGVVGQLLDTCRQLHILVTSRILLHLSREHEYPVPPLSLPHPHHLPPLAALSQYDAVALFIERAQAAKPSFAITNENAPAVAEICYRLDGLPLAIELAAARIRLFPPQALLGRLSSRLRLLTGGARDRPTRQQTLRGAMDWSYSLLDQPEQVLFARLAVFAGGFTLEAAESICDAAGDLGMEVLDGVSSLAEKSLVRQKEADEPCFMMLETIREYATERLVERGEQEELRRQHAAYYLELAEQAAGELAGPGQGAWLDRLEAERDNLRAALDWTREQGEGELGLRLAVGLGKFWEVRGPLSEGRSWLEALLRVAEGVPAALRAEALYLCGSLIFSQGHRGDAAGSFEQSLELYRELGDQRRSAEALGYLARSLFHRGEGERAVGFLEESIALGRELGDRVLLASSLRLLAGLSVEQRAFERARELGEESLGLYRELGDTKRMADVLRTLATAAYEQGALERARVLAEETIGLLRQVSLDVETREWLNDLAFRARLPGDYRQAAQLLEEVVVQSLAVGDRRSAAHARTLLALMAREQGQFERAAALYEEALGVFQEVEDLWGAGIALVGLGEVARDQGEVERTRSLCQAGLTLFRDLGDKACWGFCLHGLGVAARLERDYQRAEQLLEESVRILRQHGAAEDLGEVLASIGVLALEREEYRQAERAFVEGLRLSRLGGSRWVVAMNLEGLAAVALREEEAERAARLLGAAEAIRTAIGTPTRPIDHAGHERTVRATREALGDNRFSKLAREGATMAVDESIDYALKAFPNPSPIA